MVARLLFLGRLRDQGADLEMAPAGIETLSELREWIAREAPDVASVLHSARVRVAIDGEIVHDENAPIAEAREIAFLPPMSGG